MPTDHRATLATIRRFDQLIVYLRDEMGWPIAQDSFDDVDDLFYDFTPEELGIDSRNAAKIQEIRRLRPLSTHQPWGIFFVKFERKRLPVVALRRILSQVALKKRASANSDERASWSTDDLLFVSNYGEGDSRQISFAHFSQNEIRRDLPTLKILGWDFQDTPLHLDRVAELLTERLSWPDDEHDREGWGKQWRSAFTLRQHEVITTSKELSVELALLARKIRVRINTVLSIETEDGVVTRLMGAFKNALVHDLTKDGFADMYAQTIAYGLLSARVAHPSDGTADSISTEMPTTNPFIKELMETFLRAGGGSMSSEPISGLDFDELGVSEVVELLDAANMEAVIRDFGDRNPMEDPVTHFYERFFAEYDSLERFKRGVFYTPRPVVSFIVRSVDELLRTELGLKDGLADTSTWGEMIERNENLQIPKGANPEDAFVQILDPATGTATFLVEVIDLVHKTMIEKWRTEGVLELQIPNLWNEYVPKHLLPRLHGYELLMAPYAIAHMKIGLKLYETGYRFESAERARVYLTNTLEPPQDFSGTLAFAVPALAHEAQAVNEIKQHQQFTVVIGNPPYSGLSANMTEYAQQMVDAYKVVDGKPLNERKLWLQDDYVKFLRQAQTTIETTGVGVLGYITNHGYIDNPTFRGMRQSLMGTYNSISIVDLHGNTNKSERAPDGTIDKNVFDIRQGVAICLAMRGATANRESYRHSDLWGNRAKKYESLIAGRLPAWIELTPSSPFYFLVPRDESAREEYEAGVCVTDIFPQYVSAPVTARDHFVVAFTRQELLSRISEFRSTQLTDSDVREKFFLNRTRSTKYPPGDTRGWKLPAAREQCQTDTEWESRAVICDYRAFDRRYAYWADWMVDWPRPDLTKHVVHRENICLVTRRQMLPGNISYFLITENLPIDGVLRSDNKGGECVFPLNLYEENTLLSRSRSSSAQANISEQVVALLSEGTGLLWSEKPSGDLVHSFGARDVLAYVYAILYSPNYRSRYEDQIRVNFPRIPLAPEASIFSQLARMGARLIDLHLLVSIAETPQDTPERIGSRATVETVTWSSSTVWIDREQTSGFRGIAEETWLFKIGAHQVCEKWLKDRKGRTLSEEDIICYQKVVAAIRETISVMDEIDESIELHGGWLDAFALR
jgi:hypothetical protein